MNDFIKWLGDEKKLPPEVIKGLEYEYLDHLYDAAEREVKRERLKLSYTRVFGSLWEKQSRINAFRGGARSSKTWSILQAIALWLITGEFGKGKFYEKGRCSVVRETLPSLKASAYKDFQNILHQMGCYDMVDHVKTTLEFHFDGREVSFFSSDDLNSAKLRGRQQTFFYINEANTVSFEAFNQLIMRTEQFCILDYNPAGKDNWCHDYIEGTRVSTHKDVKIDVSTYKDNPHIPPEMVREIKGLKDTDPDLYKVYTKGEWVDSRNLVYPTVNTCYNMPQSFDAEYWGLDFGWNDPTVLVHVRIAQDCMYIDQLIYQSELTTDQLADELISMDLPKIYTDHSPRLMKDLKTRGVRGLKRAAKGPDRKEQCIGFIRSHKIFITETSLDAIREFRGYRYKIDRETDKPTDKPIDRNDHAPDATAYAISHAIRRKIRIT